MNGSMLLPKVFDLDSKSHLVFMNLSNDVSTQKKPKESHNEETDIHMTESGKHVAELGGDGQKPRYTNVPRDDYNSYETPETHTQHAFAISVNVQKRAEDGAITLTAESSEAKPRTKVEIPSSKATFPIPVTPAATTQLGTNNGSRRGSNSSKTREKSE